MICESLRMKMIGKPYSGKPNVRFDEGELEIEHVATTPALYSTVIHAPFPEDSFLNSSRIDSTPNPKITINNPHLVCEKISFRQDAQ